MTKSEDGTLVLNKTKIFNAENCYIYQRGGTKSKYWQFYYWDSEGREGFRIRRSLRTKDFLTAQSLAQKEYINIKAKIQNEESLQTLTVGEMARIFLAKKKSTISSAPHAGVTPETYRVLKNKCRKLIDYLGENTRVDHLKRNAFEGYEQWRRDGHGGKIPKTKTTIKAELSTFKSVIQNIAVKDKRVISNSPDIPEIKVPRTEARHRRNHFRDDELKILLRTIHEWKEEDVIRKTAGLHRKIIACAIELMLNSGIRVGAAKKIRWRDIRINSRDSREQQRLYRIITVPPENNKTGKEYECNCEVALVLNRLRTVSSFTKSSDLLFCNQKDGKSFSSRIWADAWNQIIAKSKLENDTGRKFSYYSLRHTYATISLANKVPLQLLASNMDTSTKYIQDHYYHHEPEGLTAELNPIKRTRKLTGGEMYSTYVTPQ
ncbi:site-specific integrase [Vulcanococcus sp. Clear-D1]|uniref:tyrosine-type recombinase/integrase n=1 Tax=Vulcanococcus sp. Clear-D1 TaxID=2766970 RepID=UPI00198F8B3F|nr:site-specific integrase [Vulcanococcus sp. Clear-D1]MBD1193116.1 site-specific integrase [Vulcanococcus sp. Clear-D1]